MLNLGQVFAMEKSVAFFSKAVHTGESIPSRTLGSSVSGLLFRLRWCLHDTNTRSLKAHKKEGGRPFYGILIYVDYSAIQNLFRSSDLFEQGSLNYPFQGESNNAHFMVILKDFPYNSALFGLVKEWPPLNTDWGYKTDHPRKLQHTPRAHPRQSP